MVRAPQKKVGWWESLTTSEGKEEVPARVYRCPEDGEIVAMLPLEEEPTSATITVTCSNGHRVKVPKGYYTPEEFEQQFVGYE